MKDLVLKRRNTKRKKPRMVVIEGFYEHPPGKEIVLPDTELIKQFELSIKETINTLYRVELHKPQVTKHNLLAKKIYSSVLDELKRVTISLKKIDEVILESQKASDLIQVIILLKEKQKILSNLELQIKSNIATLDALELEAYPKEIDRSKFFTEYNLIIEAVSKLYKEFKERDEKVPKEGIAKLMVAKLKTIREEIVANVVYDHRKVCEEFKEDEGTITASQYARIINAKNNLAFLAKEFEEIIIDFDEKIRFEQIVLNLEHQTNILIAVCHQINTLRNTYPTNILLRDLDAILINPEQFNIKEFTVSVSEPLPSKEKLEHKTNEIHQIYLAMIDVLRKYQSSFDLKQEIKPILDRRLVLEAIGYTFSLDLPLIERTIESSQITINDEQFLAKLISLKVLNDQILFEKEQINVHINQWKMNFPALELFNNRSFFYDNEYPLQPFVFRYIELREKLFKALENNDDRDEHYKKLFDELISVQSELKAYMQIQDELAPQLRRINTLLSELTSTINHIPLSLVETAIPNYIEETDRHFLNEFIRMRSTIMQFKGTLCVDKISQNNQTINQLFADYNQELKNYKKFKQGFKTIKDLRSFFKGVLNKVYAEKVRILEQHGINEPRLNILETIEELFQTRIGTLKNLSESLKTLLYQNNADTKKLLKSTLEQINMVQTLSIEQVKSIISDERLKKLSIPKFNPLVAWIIKLINPLLTIQDEEYTKQRDRFFRNSRTLMTTSLESFSLSASR